MTTYARPDHQAMPATNDTTATPPQPLKPIVAGPVSHESVPLTWEVTGDVSHITHFSLSYKKAAKRGPLMIIQTEDAATKCTVEDLDPDTVYQFRVFANTDGQGQSAGSEMSDDIETAPKTLQSTRRPISDQSQPDVDILGQIYREELRDQSQLEKPVNDQMPIYQVPLTLAERHVKERIQKFEFGTKPDNRGRQIHPYQWSPELYRWSAVVRRISV